ncbi:MULTISPECIES: DUF6747 family protein [Bacteroidota]|uniref:DUF6747 family protein n=1 Tax=Bacteroidota TaxID=976 RepID=UPI00268EE298|nr:DUF6747 family protein [Euzebyella marina]
MNTITLIKNIYLDSIRNIGNFVIRNYFKAFTWFTIILFSVVLYAFFYRIFTGFPF